jgi:hypothetical protein
MFHAARSFYSWPLELLHIVQETDYFRIGPILIRDELAPQDAIAVDDVTLWNLRRSVHCVYLLTGISHRD